MKELQGIINYPRLPAWGLLRACKCLQLLQGTETPNSSECKVTMNLGKLPLAALPFQSLPSPYMHHISGGASPSSYHLHPSLLSIRSVKEKEMAPRPVALFFNPLQTKASLATLASQRGTHLGIWRKAWFLMIHWWRADVDCSLQILLEMHVLNDPSITSWVLRWMKSGTRKNGGRSWGVCWTTRQHMEPIFIMRHKWKQFTYRVFYIYM